MFGHQDDLAYGVNWKYEDGRSDIKDVTGDYPGSLWMGTWVISKLISRLTWIVCRLTKCSN